MRNRSFLPSSFAILFVFQVFGSCFAQVAEPTAGPKFSFINAGVARLSPDKGKLLLQTPFYRDVAKTVVVPKQVPKKTTETVVDNNGKQQVVEREVIETVTETREIMVQELAAMPVYKCDLDAVRVYGLDGKAIPASKLPSLFAENRKVVPILRPTDIDPYFASFLNADVLFVESNKWQTTDMVSSLFAK